MLVTSSLQMKMNLLWMVLEDPMGIQDHMHQWKNLSSFGFYNASNCQKIQIRRGIILWPCHFTHESFGIKYLEHSPHKVKWIITSRIGLSMCGRWVGEFDWKVEGLAWNNA